MREARLEQAEFTACSHPTIDRNRSPKSWDVNGYTIKGLTLDVWQYLDRYLASQGWAPSYREFMEYCGISSRSLVSYHLGLLNRCGVIRQKRATPRAIQLLKPFPYLATTPTTPTT